MFSPRTPPVLTLTIKLDTTFAEAYADLGPSEQKPL